MDQAAAYIKAAQQGLSQLCSELALAQPTQSWLLVSVAKQSLYLISSEGGVLAHYPISSAKKGVGNQQGSLKTPLGLHYVAEKMGDGCASGTVFQRRQSIGECAVIESQPLSTGLDCITSRILWLQGLEPGVNSEGEVDSYQRYIYIHGTHEEGLIGQPASIGCIRMRNEDVIELYGQVDAGTWVYILE